jgi:alpha-beta hydrolase superfamily lysophospholipase
LADLRTPFTVASFTASDGYRWQYRYYAPAKDGAGPVGEVICLHGIQSHAGWYEYSSSRLSQVGYGVYFLDRRGSGCNLEQRGDTPNYRRLLADVSEFVDRLGQNADQHAAPGPVFLMGISWGAKLALVLAAQQPERFRGVLLLCPGLFPRVGPTIGERLRIAWARLIRPKRLFDIPLSDAELFTATPRWLDFLRADALSLHRATARFLVESVRLDRQVRFLPARCRVPVLVLLAEKDRIIDNAATRRFVERFTSAEREVIEYPGAHHTLEFEPDPERHISDMLNWLNRRA